MENKTIDARGLACPLPVVNAKKASDEMTDDGILTVLVDNEIAVQNLTKFGTGRGYPTSSEKKVKRNIPSSSRFLLTELSLNLLKIMQCQISHNAPLLQIPKQTDWLPFSQPILWAPERKSWGRF